MLIEIQNNSANPQIGLIGTNEIENRLLQHAFLEERKFSIKLDVSNTTNNTIAILTPIPEDT